jgi:hypothetical protein
MKKSVELFSHDKIIPATYNNPKIRKNQMKYTRYGIIKDNHLILYNLKPNPIAITSITEIKISQKQPAEMNFLNFFKKLYDFTIVINNQEQISFSFSKKHLSKAIAFKTRIWHTKFSLETTH